MRAKERHKPLMALRCFASGVSAQKRFGMVVKSKKYILNGEKIIMTDMNLYITLAVVIFMIVMFAINKLPYGVIAITCAVVLCLTHVLDFHTAMAGFAGNTVLMVAPTMVIAGAIGKTSIIGIIRNKMTEIQGKSQAALLILFALFGIFLDMTIEMGTATLLMLVVVNTLVDKEDLSHSRMIMIAVGIIGAWFGRIPFGVGTSLSIVVNGNYAGLVEGHPEMEMGIYDLFRMGILSSVLLTVFCLVAWRLIPRTKVDVSAFSGDLVKAASDEKQLAGWQEAIVYIVFLAVMLCYAFSQQAGELMYIMPMVGVLIFIFTKIFEVKEVVNIVTMDLMWMLAGIAAVSAAMNSSGAGEAIGRFALRLLGERPSALTVTLVFGLITVILTNLMFNLNVVAIMTPIAVSTALVAGMNPRAMASIVFTAACFAIALPTACTAATIGFATTGISPAKFLKFSLLYIVVGMVGLVISAYFIFPLYG